jgi:class 3 adenylate cyclase/tetratricopeptide (TPR) repeat protein
VSVLFVDLVGFTTFSEGRDPEEVRGMLSDYFARAEQVIGLYGGVVEKFIGDAVMAVWGTPVAREDDGGRAVRAALELIASVTQLGRSLGADIQARAGVFTGEAAVNLAAQGQGMVAGDSVNTASRLQSAAAPGTVLVDRSTYLSARDAVAFQAVGDVMLKGKGDAVEAWRPLRVTAHLGGFKPADSLEPAFTGRDEEFRAVKDQLHATGRERKPRIVSLIGVGGIGKSRLVWELYKYVDGLTDDIMWHQGRSPSYGEGVAFWALAEMVRMRARIAETDDDEAASAKLDDCLSEFVGDQDEREWLKPHLAHLIGLKERNDVGREQLFAAWRMFFERIAEEAPTLLIFEDLHWADPGLMDFIEHLMEWSRNSPILVLTLARPELLERRPTWGAGQRNFSSLQLEPLGDDDMSLLLKSVAADLPKGVQEEITRRAEGVPLYAVEMVRMLIDRNDLTRDGDAYRWIGTTSSIEVPDSLHSLIASRLDSLPQDDRLLVQDAAVLGKTFTLPSLSAVTSRSEADLEPQLHGLVRRQILLVDTDPRSPERGQYGFVQSLIREVAYQTLSKQNRRDRHISAARFFESTGDPDLIDVVATHYMEAHANSTKGAEASDLADRARLKLIEAAERAMSLGSSAQCLTLLQKALAITDEVRAREEILLKAGNAAALAGQLQLGISYLQEVQASASSRGARDLAMQALVPQAQAYFLMSDVVRAVQIMEEVVAGIADDTTPEAAVAYMELARYLMLQGDHEGTEENVKRGMPAAEKHRNIALIAEGLVTRGTGAAVAGRTVEADAVLNGALLLAKTHGLHLPQLRAYNNKSENQLRMDPRAAMDDAVAGFALAQRFGARVYEGSLLATAIAAALHLGDWDWCASATADLTDELISAMGTIILPPLCLMQAYIGNLDEATRYLEIFVKEVSEGSFMQDEMALAGCHCTIALVDGRLHDAIEAADQMRHRELGAESDYDLFISPFGSHGRAALWAGEVDAAREVLRKDRDAIVQNPWLDCRMATLQAGIAALEGDRDRAVETYAGALRGWDALDIPLGRALCQMDFALVVGGEESASAREEATTFFGEAGNDHFLKRLAEAP